MRTFAKPIGHALYFAIFATALLLLAIVPFRGLYAISRWLAWLLHRVYRYRVITTRRNLLRSFPSAGRDEIRRIERNAYRNLADVTVEALRGFTLSRGQVERRYRIENPELLNAYYAQGQSVIGVTGHIANWEWGALAAALQIRHRPIAFYKPLSNPLIDRLLRWTRTRRGTTLAPITQTAATFQATAHEPCIYLLVADQSPTDMTKAVWTTFLNQDTPCLHGPEKYAGLYRYPVVFIHIRRVKQGFYRLRLSEISPSPGSLPPGELTRRYMATLEAAIRESPADWLWSHRRWKRRRAAPPPPPPPGTQSM